MKYYMIAGEASGDLHGSNLIKELKKLDAAAAIRCWGGDLMKAAGGDIAKHYRDLAFMGFIEVVKNLPTILRNLHLCKEDISRFQPDVLILIDYPGFNLRVAKWAKKAGLKVIYYISPQVWAWKESRVKLIKKVVHKMLVILPFEKDFYLKWDYAVEYVGHPLVQVITEFSAMHASPSLSQKPVIALLPGSRKQEVAKKLPLMAAVEKEFPEYQFIVAKASSLEDEFYFDLLKDHPHIQTVRDDTYGLLSQATAALVTSGTATLETALFGVPQVVCYKGSPVSYQIARRLLKIKYISLVNLIMDKKIVTELIQDELTPQNISTELKAVLHNAERISKMKKDYAELKVLLQKGGNASAHAAQEIILFLHPTSSPVI